MKPPTIYDPNILLRDCLEAGVKHLRESENRYANIHIEPLYLGNPAELVGVKIVDGYAGRDYLVKAHDWYDMMKAAVDSL